MAKRRLLLNENQLKANTDSVYTDISSSLTLTDSLGGATYSIGTKDAFFLEFAGQKWLHVNLSGINSSGTPSGTLIVGTGGLITSIQDFKISYCSKFSGSNATDADQVYPKFVTSSPFNIVFERKTSNLALPAPTFSNGRITFSINIFI